MKNIYSIKKVCLLIGCATSFAIFMATPYLPSYSYAQNPVIQEQVEGLDLPTPGSIVRSSPKFEPPLLKGIIIHPENAFEIDFVLDEGNSELSKEDIKVESTNLIKFFLASLTMPEDELWVNLSPYEKDRMISKDFGKTEMGRVFLAQDYLLKQVTASMIDPQTQLGKAFWDRIYEQANQIYGRTDVPINTYNKVWIVPEKAIVYENGDRAFIVESHLKVLLDEDYVALSHGDIWTASKDSSENEEWSEVTLNIFRELILPAIETEINFGQNFAQLRQIYHSFILASWYKKNLQESILHQNYIGKKTISGLEVDDITLKDKIYQQYLDAFKSGVFDYIKEDHQEEAQEIIPRKYFSGGLEMIDVHSSQVVRTPRWTGSVDLILNLFVDQTAPKAEAAMYTKVDVKSQFRANFKLGDDIFLAFVVKGFTGEHARAKSLIDRREKEEDEYPYSSLKGDRLKQVSEGSVITGKINNILGRKRDGLQAFSGESPYSYATNEQYIVVGFSDGIKVYNRTDKEFV